MHKSMPALLLLLLSFMSACGRVGYDPLAGSSQDDAAPPEECEELCITSHSAGETVTSFAQTFVGDCDSQLGFDAKADSPGFQVVSFSCVGNVMTVNAEFQAGSGPRTIFAANGSTSLSFDFLFEKECPPGFIGVPGNSFYNTQDLCLAKYEMKSVNDNGTLSNGGNGNVIYDSIFVAQSRWDGTPWVRLHRDNASNECNNMSPVANFAGNYRIPTNAEWQTVARNIEGTDINWSGGVVGSGMIPTGNSDDSEGFLVADPDDSRGYINTNNNETEGWGTGAEQRRTLNLASGEVIWDLAGNGREWVSDDIIGTSLSPSMGGGFQEFSDTNRVPNPPATNRDLFGPSLTAYDSGAGMGQFYGGSGGGVLRGGLYGIWGRPTVGIFAVDLDLTPQNETNGAGHAFRCVYQFP
jgi:hypothetical protein